MRLLSRLDRCKEQFGPAAARRAELLLTQIRTWLKKNARSLTAGQLIHTHETLLFLRAYPHSPRVLRRCDEILFGYSRLLRGRAPSELAEFEYADVSGVAGTGLTTNFSYAFARSLAARHAGNQTARSRRQRGDLRIDWDRYRHADRLGAPLARLIPDAREDWAIAPHADWRAWFESAGGDLRWLLERVGPEIYDLLEIPLRFEVGDSEASRSRARIPRRSIFYHQGPLLARKDISFAGEFAAPPIPVTRLAPARARRILGVIVDASAVRYRELYGFEYPDEAHVFHADLGRGMDLFFCGVPRRWRLPHREYCAGMYFKNGVPAGYVEVMWTPGAGKRADPRSRMEVGFNLYYTFRQGETAWLYARLLKLFHQRFGVTAFTIDPYQLGHENQEALESGAFWFYAKLGFRSQSKRVRELVAREQQRIAGHPAYRTPPRILRKLAAVPMIYDPDDLR